MSDVSEPTVATNLHLALVRMEGLIAAVSQRMDFKDIQDAQVQVLLRERLTAAEQMVDVKLALHSQELNAVKTSLDQTQATLKRLVFVGVGFIVSVLGSGIAIVLARVIK